MKSFYEISIYDNIYQLKILNLSSMWYYSLFKWIDNEIGHHGCQLLNNALLLGKFNNLTLLNLQSIFYIFHMIRIDNHIGIQECIGLCQLLEQGICPNLKSLQLRGIDEYTVWWKWNRKWYRYKYEVFLVLL